MSNREQVKLNLYRSWRGYEAFMILIAVLEGLMMIYGGVKFDFRELRRKLYFACYVLLFCCTVIAFVINRCCMKSGKHDNLLTHNVYIYSGILIFWSAAISALDMIGGGYPVTYMTILAAVGSLVPLSPLMYGSMAVLSSVGMLVLAGRDSLRLTFYLNHVIFLLVVVAVEIRNYRFMHEQFLLDKRLEELAEIDGLTKVANRRSLDKYIAQLVEEGKTFSFSLLDVDNFKSVNDIYGHPEGDASLTRIAGILTEIFGQRVFRYGGDEFAVVSFEEPQSVAEKMNSVNLRLQKEVRQYALQICAGVYHRQPQDDERRVFELADCALYEAKQNGKARAVVYSGVPRQLSGNL